MNAAAGTISRRAALQAGGLALAFTWIGGGKAFAAISPRQQPGDAAAALADGNPAFAPNAFIRIDADGGVRLVMPMAEMGQAIYTGSAMLLAEELGVDLDQVRVEHSPANEALYGMPLLGGQITGGSTSTRGTYGVLREAGAVARTLLVSAAAAQWKVEPESCTVARGVVSHSPSGRQLGFGTLAGAAAKLPMPAKVALKEPKDFRLIGQPLRRVDSAAKVNGTTQFGIDVRVPGMKVATVKASPTLGGVLASVDDKAARAIPGVIAVLRIKDAVAVVGEHFWAAKRGLDALKVQWTPGRNAALTTQQLREGLADALAKGKAIVGKEAGKRPEGTLVQSTYDLPMLAHATMEPLNTTVHVRPDGCDVWVGTQVPARCVSVAAKITGLAEDKVTVHNQYLGGGFGRRLETDSVEQAVAFAKQVPYPLKVVWTREEDIRHDIVRPMYHDEISAVVDGEGRIQWFGDRISGGTVLGRWAPAFMGKDGMDGDLIECVAEPCYDLPNLKVEWVRHDMPPGLNVGWWRGVGPTHNLFVMESFIDELAHRAKKDPVAYRRAMLQKNPRTLAVLDLAASKAGWGQSTLPARVGRGVAVGDAFGSRVCAIVEAEVSPQGEVRMRRAVVALDCGIAVNTGSIEAQIQGGLLFGLSAALYSEITLRDGAIEQSNFHDYRTLRINESPPIEVHMVKSAEAPGGLGEVGTAIAAPALANAIFAATGVRLRALPVNRALLAQDKEAMKKKIAEAPHDEGRSA
ncbi:molybdopterin cofactor-binding domain-containing protein [Variovorax sp. NFACC27]|uniref:xanthine dehydrogenase family protein molybdopterin-binding subunit n=1 Tax=unclassified Variovorax TaxID=663243 RepID=UPI00089A9F4C|nr:isoquinoline 1-oxidoreductase, beta subunit [Variovorax sp. NFACC28]SEG87176.1 isoquinoline 1-oxidoreductase, beta subunit [Variovorax sp. NFACC29]SFD29561.1 isoquinoline 1-oxidoreductase, beta subunit [Variovorax sp. NFACC26]SFG33089.1 isoquinoline 1-oxidoreductase, beta subunit [Variovorax sp. NFACC27]